MTQLLQCERESARYIGQAAGFRKRCDFGRKDQDPHWQNTLLGNVTPSDGCIKSSEQKARNEAEVQADHARTLR